MPRQVVGVIGWSGNVGPGGEREWRLVTRVQTEYNDGPLDALLTPGLPLPGSPYVVGGDVDLWAFCTLESKITPVISDEPNKFYDVEQVFKTPTSDSGSNSFGGSPTRGAGNSGGGTQVGACKTPDNQNPLLEPQKISGGASKKKVEAEYDRFGVEITNSAFEPIKGAPAEFDRSVSTLRVEQNVIDLEYDMVTSLLNCVNDDVLWGNEARTVLFTNWSWDVKYYGLCFRYYTRVLEFEIDPEGFDRDVLDEGTKALAGKFDPITGRYVVKDIGGNPADPNNPSHFNKFHDRKNQPARVILNGFGLPANVDVGTGTGSTATPPGQNHIEYYKEKNLLMLGVPDFWQG
jgi:hypothetical protein